MKIGDTIRDIEDGDCYFEGTATEIVDGKVTKYLLTKIVWSDEVDEDDDRLNTEIEPQWWYIENITTRTMTKEQAREYLQEYLKNNEVNLPIVDEIVMRMQTPFVIADMTFLGLMCIAYDLRPIQNDEL